MDLKKLGLLLLFFVFVNAASAQLKIGENPNSIDPTSIVEMESTSKALVLTRLTTVQMQNIAPLRGAMIYNTDTKCIHYYNGTQWNNLCQNSGQGTFSFVDNGNGTFTINYSDGTSFTSPNLTGPQGIQGDKGDQGDVGPQGIQGEKGDQGDVGPQGIQGEKGDQGDVGPQGIQGDTGPQGIQGDKGDKGDKGDQGDVGPQGIQGDIGSQGIQGEKGDKGDQGDVGPQGIQGEKGDQGDQGDQGDVGPQGIQGEKGDKGDKGDVGPQGIQGDKGDQGDVGPQGIQGDKGDQGNVGPQGIQGVKGDQGDDGPQGIQGDKGDQGNVGPQGIQGDVGPQGIQGEKGDQGDTGPQGIQGDVGTQGIQGVKGDQGDVGPQGIQGDVGPQGIQGEKGDQGDVGPQGIQGEKGDKGDQGDVGPQGIQGEKGDQGDKGDKGDAANPSWELLGNAGTDSTTDFVGTTDGQDLILKSNNIEKIRLVQNKNQVLINQAPTFNNHPLVIKANGVDVLAFQDNTGAPKWHWNLIGNGLNFVESNVADYRLFLETGGQVGINTNAPSEQLDVNGNARIRTLTAATNSDDIMAADASGVLKRSKINYGGRWTNSNTSTNLNVNNTIVPIFGSQDYVDDGTNLYQVSGNTLVVKETGRYDIRANLSLLAINSSGSTEARTNTNVRIAINGAPVGAIGASGYIRYASGHDHSSIHVNEILQLNANDVVTIITYREASSGVVRFNGAGSSSFVINKLR